MSAICRVNIGSGISERVREYGQSRRAVAVSRGDAVKVQREMVSQVRYHNQLARITYSDAGGVEYYA
jgi:hypothetical protein